MPIVGATNDQIVLGHAQFSDAGTHSVVVSNAEGSVTSADARLTVNSPTGGDLDYSFAWGGLGRAFERVASITVQADGKILVAGELRRNQPLDYAFECRWDDPIHVHERTFRGLRRDPLCRDPFGRCSSRRQRCSSGASSLR